MAIAYVGERGTRNVTNGSTSTETVTLASDCTAGNTVVLFFAARCTSTSGVSVTDSKGNTWLIAVGPLNSSNNFGFIASTTQDVGTLVTGDVITITAGATLTNRMGPVEEFSGLYTAGTRRDKTASNQNTGSVGTGDTGTSSPLAHLPELAVALVVTSNASNFSSTSLNSSGTVGTWSSFTTARLYAGGTNPKGMFAGYRIVTDDTPGQKLVFDYAGTSTYQAMLATYRSRGPENRTLLGVG